MPSLASNSSRGAWRWLELALSGLRTFLFSTKPVLRPDFINSRKYQLPAESLRVRVYEAWFEQVESLVDARCTGCACCSWDGENYSECRPSTEAYPCDQPTEYCVWCEDDGETPMPGRWTTHARQCQMYEHLLDGRRDNVITRRAKTLAILKDFYGRANPDKVANARAIATEYEGFEELLYDRLQRQYKYVPGGPFKVWRTGPPFPAPEARDIIPPESPDL